jgi:hypothetical protein
VCGAIDEIPNEDKKSGKWQVMTMTSKDRFRIGVLTKGMPSFYNARSSLMKYSSSAPLLHTLTAAHPFNAYLPPMNIPQVCCHECDRVFNPRGLSQHLSKTQNSGCRALLTALKTLSAFQTAPCAGSSLGSNSNSGLDTAHAADTTPTTDAAEDAAEDADPIDPADATDADLLEALANNHSAPANTEQDHPVEAQSQDPLAPQPDEPWPPAPPPTQPDADSLDAPPEFVVDHFPHGSPGTQIPDAPQGSSLYQSSREAFGASVWAPFHSQCDWEIAHWAKMCGPTSSAMEELLAIPEVRAYEDALIVSLTCRQRSSINSDCHITRQSS